MRGSEMRFWREVKRPQRLKTGRLSTTYGTAEAAASRYYWWALRTCSSTAGSASGVAPGRAANQEPMRLAASFMAERGAPRRK